MRHATDWRELLDEQPRAPFLPEVIWTDGPDRTYVPVSRTADPQRWAELTDGDRVVITQVDDGEPVDDSGVIPTSSASQPRVVALMLDALDVQPGQSVLEIGTGTGWNAALLARRVGPSGRIVSVEVDPNLATSAQTALDAAGFGVDVIIGDGEHGEPGRAPFDRLIATASARHIPHTWVQQVRPGGVIVAPWGTDYCNGTLARLVVSPGGMATGTLTPGIAFMRLRSQRRYTTNPDGVPLDVTRAEHTRASVDGMDLYRMVTASEAAFTIGLLVPDCRMLYEEDARGERHHVVELHDTYTGSWSLVNVNLKANRVDVYQHAPRRLWDEVLAAYGQWQEDGKPSPEDYTLTVSSDGHAVTLD